MASVRFFLQVPPPSRGPTGIKNFESRPIKNLEKKPWRVLSIFSHLVEICTSICSPALIPLPPPKELGWNRVSVKWERDYYAWDFEMGHTWKPQTPCPGNDVLQNHQWHRQHLHPYHRLTPNPRPGRGSHHLRYHQVITNLNIYLKIFFPSSGHPTLEHPTSSSSHGTIDHTRPSARQLYQQLDVCHLLLPVMGGNPSQVVFYLHVLFNFKLITVFVNTCTWTAPHRYASRTAKFAFKGRQPIKNQEQFSHEFSSRRRIQVIGEILMKHNIHA